MNRLFKNLWEFSDKPPLFEPGESRFWDDPHISQSMLEAHLNPDHDGASRRPEIIDQTIEHFLSSGILKPGCRVLDLGCGPGLYAQRLSQAGVRVVGLDISRRSLDYAIRNANESGLTIDYLNMNFFDMDYREEFDAVLQVFGELCVFSNDQRDILVDKIHKALKKKGIFIFDVSTRIQRVKRLKNRWYLSTGGFWRPGKHLVLEQGFDYPEEDVWLDQYIIIDDQGCKVYRNWFHDYSAESITQVLEHAGFKVAYLWNDLTGREFSEDGEWMALAAVKR